MTRNLFVAGVVLLAIVGCGTAQDKQEAQQASAEAVPSVEVNEVEVATDSLSTELETVKTQIDETSAKLDELLNKL
ncbi:hypothetical protein V6R21_22795 [Limibacter armeniacum]|uniref:hypothetical protein n=1 Tax=Limibacter armeniacum TaxID=466084 RepID=UPI002FE6B055